MTVSELMSEEEIRQAFAILRDFRGHLSEAAYLELVGDMSKQGYRMFGLRDSRRLVSVAGVRIISNFRWGRHLWVYDLVTGAADRSKGYGGELLGWLEEFAARNGCSLVALSSDISKSETHRFFEERMSYKRLSYVFSKRVVENE
jgi:GNAT superfamily N-acetyltransferase